MACCIIVTVNVPLGLCDIIAVTVPLLALNNQWVFWWIWSLISPCSDEVIDPYCVELTTEHIRCICIFSYFWTLGRRRLFKSLPAEGSDPFILYVQYNYCWLPGDARSWCISSYGVDGVLSGSFSISIKRVHSLRPSDTYTRQGYTHHWFR